MDPRAQRNLSIRAAMARLRESIPAERNNDSAANESADVVFRYCQEIFALCLHEPSSSIFFVENGGIHLLVLVLRHRFSEDTRIPAMVCGYLDGLLESDANRVKLQEEAGAIAALLQAMQDCSELVWVPLFVCRALAGLASIDETSRVEIATQGGINSLLATVSRFPEHIDLQVATCRALWMMFQDGAHQQILNEKVPDIVRAIIDAMNRNPNVADIQKNACGVLAQVSTNSDFDTVIVSSEGIQALLTAAQIHHEADTLLIQAFGALANLAAGAGGKDVARRHGAIRIVIDAMERYSTVERVIDATERNSEVALLMRQALHAFYSLVLDDDDDDALAVQVNTGSRVVAVMRALHESESVQTMGAKAIGAMSINAANRMLLKDEGAIDALLVAMTNHSRSWSVLQDSCKSLWQLAEDPLVCAFMANNEELSTVIEQLTENAEFPMLETLAGPLFKKLGGWLHRYLKQEPAKQQLDLIRSLVGRSPKVVRKKCENDDDLPVCCACAAGSPHNIIEYLAELYPEGLLVPDSSGRLPLHRACEQKATLPPTIKFLVNHGSGGTAVRTATELGVLPVHFAVVSGLGLRSIRTLVEAYPESLKIPDYNGCLPLHFACSVHQHGEGFLPDLEVIRFLAEHPFGDGTAKALRILSYLPLHCACTAPADVAVIEYLVGLYPKGVEQTDDAGFLPVHLACRHSASLGVVQLLVRACPEAIYSKCDPPISMTPYQMACNPTRDERNDRICAWLDAVQSGRIMPHEVEVPLESHAISTLALPIEYSGSPKFLRQRVEPIEKPKKNPREMHDVACLTFRALLELDSFPTRQDMEQIDNRAFLIPPRDDVWHITFISHRWEKPKDSGRQHPDPHGRQLETIQQVIRMVIMLCLRAQGFLTESEVPPDSLRNNGWLQAAYIAGSELLGARIREVSPSSEMQLRELLLDRCAIWYDFTCLYQKPRDKRQEASFRTDLKSLRQIVHGSSCVLSLQWANDGYNDSGWCQWEIAASLVVDPGLEVYYFPLLLSLESIGLPFVYLPASLQNSISSWDQALGDPQDGSPVHELNRVSSAVQRAATEMTLMSQAQIECQFAVLFIGSKIKSFGSCVVKRLRAQCLDVIAGRSHSVDLKTIMEESMDEAEMICTNGSDVGFLALKILLQYSPPDVRPCGGIPVRTINEASRRLVDEKPISMYLMEGNENYPIGALFHFKDETMGYLLYPLPQSFLDLSSFFG